MDSGNNEWGCDDFFLLSALTPNSNFTLNNKMIFSVEIEVFGRGDLIDNANAAKIEKTNDQLGLIELADSELEDVISKLPAGRDVKGIMLHQDNIVKYRAKK